MKAFSSKLKTLAIVLGAGIIYYFIVTTTSFRIPCIFRLITGWRCPGCGISTMFVEMLHLNFDAAFKANPFIFITSPFIIFEIFYMIFHDRENFIFVGFNKLVLGIYIAALVIFGVLRNLGH